MRGALQADRQGLRRASRTVALVLAATSLCDATAQAQNLVQNPGFETGTGCSMIVPECTGAAFWTFTGAAIVNEEPSVAHSGNNSLELATGSGVATNNGTGPGTASQTVTLTRPGVYAFSFWEFVSTAAGTFNLTATVGSATAFNSNVSNTSYVQQSANVTLPAAPTTIEFSGAWVSGSTSSSLAIDDVSLVLLTATPLSSFLPPGAPINAVNVAAAIDGFSGTPPASFLNLYNFSGAQLVNALEQLDGENVTGAERGAFDLMNEFLGLLLDPFVDGRGGFSAGGQPLGFAPDQQASLPPDIALAYAGVLKAPPPPQTFAQRWTAWGAGFGGSATANGDPAIGSNSVTTSTYGYAAGMDYHYSPDTVFGFSLAGGGTNWNLADALGTGRSDAFLAGVYGVTHNGPWYLGGALAFANNWFTTNRTALGDTLTAGFQGQSYGGRLEGGYRFAMPFDHGLAGGTPYAAIQVQDFQMPAFSETDVTGSGLGLSFNAMRGTDTRSELGARFDDPTLWNGRPLILRAQVAWAHDWVSNPALNASFESLPGTGFTVNGAPIPHNSALTSAGAQLFFTPNWSFLAKFDGQFASGYQLYAGSGTLRYAW
jgi:hypothetical protein